MSDPLDLTPKLGALAIAAPKWRRPMLARVTVANDLIAPHAIARRKNDSRS